MRRALPRHWNIILAAALGVCLLSIPLWADAQSTNTWNDVIKLVIWNIVSQVGGFFVWVGGGILDFTITRFIVGYGAMFQSQGLGVAVNNLWTVARDLFNLTFIFALVYIGFRMILDSDDSGAKKAIVNLVIAALLVNFSLFFTKAIVDFTNITATQVANVLYNNNPTGSISATFVQSMGLPSLWGPSGPTVGTIDSNNIATVSWSYILGVLILCLIAAFAFIAGAALLTVRFIVLTYFMVISPIMFIGRVFPFLQSWQSNFWSTFLKNAFFAPAFLLMLYFSIYVLNQTRIIQSGGGLQQNMGASANNVNDIAMLLLVGGFLLASVIIGQKMGVVGSDVAVNVGKNLQGRGQRLVGSMTFGAGAALGQRTVGLAANRLANNEKFKNYASKNPLLGRQLYMATKKVADSSFDVRQTGAGKSLGVGEGRKGGYDSRVKEKTKQYETFLDEIGTNDDISDQEAESRARAAVESTESGRRLITEAEQANQALASRRTDLQNEIAGDLNQMRVLSTEMRNPATTEERRQQIATQINAINTSIQAVRERFSGELATLQQQASSATKALESRLGTESDDAKNKHKYQKQLQFMDELDKSNKRWGVAQRVLGGTIGFGASYLTLGALPAIYSVPAGAAVVQAASTAGVVTSDAAKKLRSSYGKNGSKKQKKKQQQEQLQLVADSLRENNALPATPAAPAS